MLIAIDRREPATPDSYDGLRCQQALDAVIASARNGRWVTLLE